MSLQPDLDRYLSFRRQLGADLATDERILRRFAPFADREGGHDKPDHTYWYLEAVPELLELVATRVTGAVLEEASR